MGPKMDEEESRRRAGSSYLPLASLALGISYTALVVVCINGGGMDPPAGTVRGQQGAMMFQTALGRLLMLEDPETGIAAVTRSSSRSRKHSLESTWFTWAGNFLYFFGIVNSLFLASLLLLFVVHRKREKPIGKTLLKINIFCCFLGGGSLVICGYAIRLLSRKDIGNDSFAGMLLFIFGQLCIVAWAMVHFSLSWYHFSTLPRMPRKWINRSLHFGRASPAIISYGFSGVLFLTGVIFRHKAAFLTEAGWVCSVAAQVSSALECWRIFMRTSNAQEKLKK